MQQERRKAPARRTTWAFVGLSASLAVLMGAPVSASTPSQLGLMASGLPAALSVRPAGSDFWQHWGDGRAELNGYRLTQPRYGEAREGSVVQVFVTEPFSYEARVKADPGRHPKSDVFSVLKLNEARDFQTGIYDYNLMTSVFTAVSEHPRVRLGHPTKVTFSAQEWCGMLFEQLSFEPEAIDQKRFSYFDGEGESRQSMAYPKGGVLVDELPIYVRGLLGGAPVGPGQERTLPMLPSVQRTRMIHRRLAWTEGRIRRAENPATVKVGAGRFEAVRYTVKLGTGDAYVYDVEADYPHRILAWTGPDGERAELLGSKRLPYWQLNREGQARYLKELGLQPPTR